VRAPGQVATDGYRSLNENQRVSLTVVKGAKGAQATNIRPYLTGDVRRRRHRPRIRVRHCAGVCP